MATLLRSSSICDNTEVIFHFLKRPGRVGATSSSYSTRSSQVQARGECFIQTLGGTGQITASCKKTPGLTKGRRKQTVYKGQPSIIGLFATSKLWYKASALPLSIKFAKKFEYAMFRFLWIGKLEKLKLDEIKNPVLAGGLNLPCVISKADCLFLS